MKLDKKIACISDDIRYIILTRNELSWVDFYLENQFGLKYISNFDELNDDAYSEYEIVDECKFSSFILKYSEYLIKIKN